jgi:hypothetical protein
MQVEAWVVGDELTIATFRVGAPATIGAMEEMIVRHADIIDRIGRQPAADRADRDGGCADFCDPARRRPHYAPQHVLTPDVRLPLAVTKRARGIRCLAGPTDDRAPP